MPIIPPGPEIFEPNERARHALAHPLRAGVRLRPSGPCTRPDMITPGTDVRSSMGAGRSVTFSPNPYRPPNEDLLGASRSERGWKDLSFRLQAGVRAGHGEYAQLWRAVVEVGGRRSGTVVLKLFAEAMWPLPHDFHNLWQPVERRVESELQAYVSLRPTQGCDVPHCYGAFPFEMPWGDVIMAVVLEDLDAVAEPLERFCEREKQNLSTIEAVHSMISASFHQLHRLDILDVGNIQPRLEDIFVLHGSTVTEPRFVFVGFSWAESAALGRRETAVDDPDLVYRWLDECNLHGAWSEVIDPDLYIQWPDYAGHLELSLVAWGGERWPGLVEETEEERDVREMRSA